LEKIHMMQQFEDVSSQPVESTTIRDKHTEK